MKREPLVFVGTCDLAGLVRGKGFPAAELPRRLKKGVGLTGSNLMLSPFGPIYDTPFGTEGDLMLVPDPGTKLEVEFDVEHRVSRIIRRRRHFQRPSIPRRCAS